MRFNANDTVHAAVIIIQQKLELSDAEAQDCDIFLTSGKLCNRKRLLSRYKLKNNVRSPSSGPCGVTGDVLKK